MLCVECNSNFSFKEFVDTLLTLRFARCDNLLSLSFREEFCLPGTVSYFLELKSWKSSPIRHWILSRTMRYSLFLRAFISLLCFCNMVLFRRIIELPLRCLDLKRSFFLCLSFSSLSRHCWNLSSEFKDVFKEEFFFDTVFSTSLIGVFSPNLKLSIISDASCASPTIFSIEFLRAYYSPTILRDFFNFSVIFCIVIWMNFYFAFY